MNDDIKAANHPADRKESSFEFHEQWKNLTYICFTAVDVSHKTFKWREQMVRFLEILKLDTQTFTLNRFMNFMPMMLRTLCIYSWDKNGFSENLGEVFHPDISFVI